ADRVPMAASSAPTVTSATGAKSKFSPAARSSIAIASAAARLTSWSSAAPLAMKSGKEVHGPVSALNRCTGPPSLSTAKIAGHDLVGHRGGGLERGLHLRLGRPPGQGLRGGGGGGRLSGLRGGRRVSPGGGAGGQRQRPEQQRGQRRAVPAPSAHATARTRVSGIPESIVMSRSEGGSPAATTAEPSAAIIAPLSVQYRIGGMRRVMPASANRSAASSRSRLLAENPPPTTTVSTPRLVAAARVLVTSTSATASEKEAAMSAAGTCAPASSKPSTTRATAVFSPEKEKS